MKMKTFYQKYNGSHVEDSLACISDEFKTLARDMRSALKEAGKERGMNLVGFTRGHYYISGFFEKDGGYVYISWDCPRGEQKISFDSADCMNGFLYRTARHDKDFTGGMNHFSDWNSLMENISALMEHERRCAA